MATTSESDGTGETTATWYGVPGETGERYDLYVSGSPFTSIYNTGVTFLGSVYEDQPLEDSNSPYTYTRQLPIGTLGWAYYCVVTVDGRRVGAPPSPLAPFLAPSYASSAA